MPRRLRDFGDKLRDKMESGIILLGSKAGDKAYAFVHGNQRPGRKISRRKHHQGTRTARRRQRRRPTRHGPGRRHTAGEFKKNFPSLGKTTSKVEKEKVDPLLNQEEIAKVK